MTKLKVMSLNAEDMADLIGSDSKIPKQDSAEYWRAKLLAEMVRTVDADIVGLVEAPQDLPRTQIFVDEFLGGEYEVQGGGPRIRPT